MTPTAVEGVVKQLSAIARRLRKDYLRPAEAEALEQRALRLLAHVARHREAAAPWGRYLEQRGVPSYHAVLPIPPDWVGMGFLGIRMPDAVLRTLAEVTAWEKAANQGWYDSSLGWLWSEEIPSACGVQADSPLKRGVSTLPDGRRVVTYYPYRDRIALGIPSATNDISRLARLWAREAPKLAQDVRALAEERLRATEVGGQILWRAQRLDDAAEVATYYTRATDGTPCFIGVDNVAYTPEWAANMIADARPWTRAEIVAQWRRHAEINDIARDFVRQVEALVGPGGLGLPMIAPALRAELEQHEAALPLLTRWVAAKLGVEAPTERPRLRPLDAQDIRRSGRHDLLGGHDEERGDIALARGTDRAVLVHELVHWVLSDDGSVTARRLRAAARSLRATVKRGSPDLIARALARAEALAWGAATALDQFVALSSKSSRAAQARADALAAALDDLLAASVIAARDLELWFPSH